MLLLIGCWATFSLACSNEKAIPTYANLYLRYDQSVESLKAEATLFEGLDEKNKQPKDVPGGISFLGGGMDSRTLPGGVVRYEYERPATLPAELPFRFKNNKGKEVEFMAHLPKIEDFRVLDLALSRASGAKIAYSGTPLTPDEKLVLFFGDANGKALTIEINGPSETSEITVPEGKLTPLANGKAQLYLVRIQTLKEEKMGCKATIQTEFYSKEQTVELVD